MRRSCGNDGGAAGPLRLPAVPVLEAEIDLPADAAAALRSWQARPGEIMTAVDPEQTCYRVRLTAAGAAPRVVPFAILSRPVESGLILEVYQALPERERFEMIVQKLTELGATRIVPVETARSTTRLQRDAVQSKSHRWPEVARRAARQCRRGIVPEVSAPLSFAEALRQAGTAGVKVIFYEGEERTSLADAVAGRRAGPAALFVGPEGGFSPEEILAARAAGFVPVSLGPRLLRTETAAIVGAALVQGLLGDLL